MWQKRVFDVVQSSLDSDITRETFDELLQNTEVHAVKLRTIGERECLFLPKEEPKDYNKQDDKQFSHFPITA